MIVSCHTASYCEIVLFDFSVQLWELCPGSINMSQISLIVDIYLGIRSIEQISRRRGGGVRYDEYRAGIFKSIRSIVSPYDENVTFSLSQRQATETCGRWQIRSWHNFEVRVHWCTIRGNNGPKVTLETTMSIGETQPLHSH